MDSKVPETNIHTSNSYPRESMNIKHTRKLLNVSNRIFSLGITTLGMILRNHNGSQCE
jgi:hypothetical protein